MDQFDYELEYEESLADSMSEIFLGEEDEEDGYLVWTFSGFEKDSKKFHAFAYYEYNPPIFFSGHGGHITDWNAEECTFYLLDDGSGELEVFHDYKRLRRVYTVTREATIQVLSLFEEGKREEGFQLAERNGELLIEYRSNMYGAVSVHFPDIEIPDWDKYLDLPLQDEQRFVYTTPRHAYQDVVMPDSRWKVNLYECEVFDADLWAGRFGHGFTIYQYTTGGYLEEQEYGIDMRETSVILRMLIQDEGNAISYISERFPLRMRVEYFPCASIRWISPEARADYKRWIR